MILVNLKLASKLFFSPNCSYTELLYKIALGDIYPMLVTYADKKKRSAAAALTPCSAGGEAQWRLTATAAGAFRPMSRKPILQFCCLGHTDGQDKPDNDRRRVFPALGLYHSQSLRPTRILARYQALLRDLSA